MQFSKGYPSHYVITSNFLGNFSQDIILKTNFLYFQTSNLLCFENHNPLFQNCFVLKTTLSLYWDLLYFEDMKYSISYVLKTISYFTPEIFWRRTDRQKDRRTDRRTDPPSPRSDLSSLKNSWKIYRRWRKTKEKNI